jgi:hypothetical protein
MLGFWGGVWDLGDAAEKPPPPIWNSAPAPSQTISKSLTPAAVLVASGHALIMLDRDRAASPGVLPSFFLGNVLPS